MGGEGIDLEPSRPRRYFACSGIELSGVKSWNERFEGTGRMGALMGLLAMSWEAFLNGVRLVSGIKPRACLMERFKSFSFWISCERSCLLLSEMASASSISHLA